MKVLAIIPTQGKRQEMLLEALQSLEGQTRKADKVDIRLGDNPLADRLNAAIRESDCDAFFILSDDDKLEPRFIEKTVAKMEEHGVDIVYTDCLIFGRRDCKGYALGEWTKPNIDRNTVPLVTSLCKKSAWEKAGGFEPVAFFDWDFWWKCRYSGATAYWLKEHLWSYRDHEGQGGNSEDLAESRRATIQRHNELRPLFAGTR